MAETYAAVRRRALVLTDEGAGHWFRQLLPHGWQSATDNAESDQDTTDFVPDNPPENPNDGSPANWYVPSDDVKLFVTTYCAGFFAVSMFFA